jgi:hypothetical protein
MRSETANRSQTRNAAIGLSVLLSLALSTAAHASEVWRINLAKSQFGPTSNTLVLDRYDGKRNTQATESNGNAAANTFLVISNAKVYLATDESVQNASSGDGIKRIDYNRWRDMKMVQIGENVRSTDYCGFSCQGGLKDNRMTLTFKTKGIDVSKQMNNLVVLNTK